MAKFSRNFIAGRMNKVVDQRLLPEGEYVDAMNIRMGSTEQSEVGVIENTKGNIPLTELRYIDGTQLSVDAKCIGAIEDSANETIYWFVHDSNFPVGATGKLDMILSYNVFTGILTYNVISIDDGGGINTTLNFNDLYLITGVNIIGDFLYFTDNYNPPRFINTNPVTNRYPNPIADVDQITAESLLVIKKPPTESPTIELINTSGQSNYLETRFISFAYRYRYADGEYSATSQWSDIAFSPNNFNFSPDSFLNEGMVNQFNTAIVTYNTGGPLVTGIDLLFKQANSNIIKVIDTFEKTSDYTDETYQFSDSKIFTILSSGELLRLYDNVPLYAQAQTIMGNRLMYGNYVEGYDLVDRNGNPTKLEYSTELITNSVGDKNITTRLEPGNYSIDPTAPVTIADSIVYLNLNGLDLIVGASISLDLRISHSAWGVTPSPQPTVSTLEVNASFTFVLQRIYTSVYQLATSVEFQQFIGTSLPTGNIKPVYSPIVGVETSCDGSTFTDQINCSITNLSTLSKWASGISDIEQAIKIVTTPGSDEIGLQLVAMKFSDDINNPSTAQYYYEYYKVIFSDAVYQKISTPRSLHSNRGYQIGIVYMDEFNRSSTALVSNLNDTVHIPCGFSIYQNQIRVTIPTTQIAPSWAKRYKFVIKPDAENYETIYSNLFFTDKDTNATYFLLEGENTKKVEVGDRYIVKADTNGALPNCQYATVLEKDAKASGFITNPTIAGQNIPAGVYMKMKANSFSVDSVANSYVDYGWRSVCAPKGGFSDRLQYPANIDDPNNPGMYIDYSIPAGSRVIFDIKFERVGVGRSCERRGYVLTKTYISTANYDNMYDWFIGDNIALTLNTGYSLDGVTTLTFKPVLRTDFAFGPDSFDTCYFQFFRNTTNNQLTLGLTTGISCTGAGYPNSRAYCVDARIEVYRAVGLIIFETEPNDALPDVFYENNLSFSIDDLGNHMGNVTDQDIAGGIAGVVDTEFFNCFCFGNGAESYKIRDSLIGRSFNLGERVNVVAAQEYKKADRFADITYSGIYNAETNVNKLNEFNLGLLDYKNLETSFGPIYKMDGRETDVLVLQEDKISYVLAGKNLLSDSTGGGAISSVPEVLGTQIARTEKYGISFNPESYVHWGASRYFTDVKRGAVLQLIGDSYSNDQIKVVSEQNMRTWFRDMFNNSFSTQKLGGFDPYMNEYVLTTNEVPIPTNPQCLACGTTQTVSIVEPLIYCVDLGSIVGETTVSWTVVSNTGAEFDVSIEYNTTTYSSGLTPDDGQITFYKDLISIETAIVTITPSSGDLVLNITAECPVPEVLTIVEVVVGNNTDATQNIHTQYRYTNGTYISGLQSNLVTFVSGTANPLVSRYNVTTGYVGAGAFPPEFSTMSMQTNKIPTDSFNFNPLNDKFRYLRTNVLYPNIPASILTAIGLSSIASPITGSSPIYQANFTVPDKTLGDVLYLIWDMRDATPTQLCYSNAMVEPQKEVCCNCSACTAECVNVTITNLSVVATTDIDFGVTTGGECNGGPFTISLNPGEVYNTCLQVGTDYDITQGTARIESTECANCTTYVYYNPAAALMARIKYMDCTTGIEVTQEIATNTNFKFCCLFGTTPTIDIGSIGNLYMTNECKCCESNSCTQWEVVISPSGLGAFIAWINCDGTEVNQTWGAGQTDYICVQSGFNPNIITGIGDCTITPYDGCIDSTTC